MSSRHFFEDISRTFFEDFEDIFEDIRQAYFLNNGIHSCVISNDIINNLKYIYFLSLIEINFNIYKIFAYLDLENFGE